MKSLINIPVLLVVVATALTATSMTEATELVGVKKIWDKAPHNAFTDLTRFQEQWFCVFREGDGHVSDKGALRVLKSGDGENWESAALITSDTADLRDAKISVSPDGRLCLAGAGALHQPAEARHLSYIWYSSDGTEWSEATVIGDPNFWIWRITWHDGAAYGVGYSTTANAKCREPLVDDDIGNFDRGNGAGECRGNAQQHQHAPHQIQQEPRDE
jgi:hypothetical protein